MRFIAGLGLTAVCVLALGLPMGAHHSHGNYVDTFMDIQGVVKEVHLVVPHSWVYLEVKDAKSGEPQIWALEATGRTGLQRIVAFGGGWFSPAIAALKGPRHNRPVQLSDAKRST